MSSAEQLLKDFKENVEAKPVGTTPARNEALLELQKQATTVQKQSKDADLAEITSYNFTENTPLSMARLISQMPWGASGSYLPMPQCMALALHWFVLGLNPFIGDIFILPSGKIGMSLQGLLKKAKNDGYKLGVAKFTDCSRDWPKGLVLSRKERGRDIDFSMEKEPGVRCEMTVNDQPVEYTAWLSNWFMPANPNWFNRMDWMLRVSAQKRCLALGTGIAVSEEIADDNAAGSKDSAPVATPTQPKKIPTGFGT